MLRYYSINRLSPCTSVILVIERLAPKKCFFHVLNCSKWFKFHIFLRQNFDVVHSTEKEDDTVNTRILDMVSAMAQWSTYRPRNWSLRLGVSNLVKKIGHIQSELLSILFYLFTKLALIPPWLCYCGLVSLPE